MLIQINKRQKFISRITLIFILIIISCKKKEPVFSSEKSDPFTKVAFDDLLNNLTYWEGKTIEIDGYYIYQSELSAIYNSSISYKLDNENKALWVDFNDKLRINGIDYKNKMIKIRGVVDINSKGHLGQYSGTIKNVFYIVEN